jgi:hypothetical protein
MIENPLAISLKQQGIHNIIDACLFQKIKPLDNSQSLGNALNNLDLTTTGCRRWLDDHKNDDYLSNPNEYDIFHSFEIEIHCLEMLCYIYVYRMEYYSRRETIQKCKQIRFAKFTAKNKEIK